MEDIRNMDATAIEERLADSGWQEVIRKLTMPQQMKKELVSKSAESVGKAVYKGWRAKVIPAFCVAFILVTSGITARAAYVNTHVRVFFTEDVTREDLDRIKAELLQLEGVSSCRYVDADAAWKEFGEAYLTPELMEGFEKNPLSGSANFVVGITWQADMDKMKADMESMDGVRGTTGLWEE
ncbi:MAG: permease-like cell division protein FtsX [Ruminococcus sp.]|nr:permease-like cell division protein FtsX [Ruminococcus sp.]